MTEGSPNGEQVEIDLGALSKSMKEQLNTYPRSHSSHRSGQPSIHRVPAHLRQGEDESAYEPKLISVGPYYHGKPRLQAMEEHKWLSLRSFLDRNRAIDLPVYLAEMKDQEDRARSCYCSETIKLQQLQKSHDFCKMMLLDGCFIIELFLKRYRAKDELIYSTRWMLPLITNDLLLLENQLPFFVLQKLFERAQLQNDQECGRPSSVLSLAIHFFEHLLPGNKVDRPPEDVHHLLHLLHYFHSRRLDNPSRPTSPSSSSHGSGSLPESSSHSSMGKAQPQQQRQFDPDPKRTTATKISKWKGVKGLVQFLYPATSTREDLAPPQRSIPGAVELHQAGVKFRVKREANSYLEVKFNNGVMEIPYLLIKDSTSTLFRNLIAFEQCHPDSDCHFTSYAFFMDCIVNTPADVALLGEHKIIEHWLGEDDAVAKLFNSLCKGVAIDTQTRHYFPRLFQKVREYCETDWHTWRARLMHDYFSNPWAIISVAAAIVLLLLTVAQTMFAVLEFTDPP